MGCGASKTEVRNETPDNGHLQDQERPATAEEVDHKDDTVYVADIDPTYPEPSPPPNQKEDIYDPRRYASVDERVRRDVRQFDDSTYQSLISSLTRGCTSDLEALRALFVWLYLQDFHGHTSAAPSHPDTPRGYLQLIRARKGSIESFFALLCRNANIPCNVIRGVGKGGKYEVGQRDMSGLESAWNAVHVAGGWRLVHPVWAFFGDKPTYTHQEPPQLSASKRATIQEFFWLTDPDKFLYFCKPQADEWQLVRTRWNQFLDVPLFTEEYFSAKLQVPKEYKGLLHSDNGVLFMEFEHERQVDISVDAQVKIEPGSSNRASQQSVNMEKFVAKASTPKTKIIIFRFPHAGWYAIDVFGGVSSSRPKIARFRAECTRTEQDPGPFPQNTTQEYGVSRQELDQLGISDLTPDSGLLFVEAQEQLEIEFTSREDLEVRAGLYHSQQPPERFQQSVSTRSHRGKHEVLVTVPEEDRLEFSVEINARRKDSDDEFSTIATYLLLDDSLRYKDRDRPKKKPKPQGVDPVRRKLIAATQDEKIDRLEKAIQDFERNKLEDLGDLSRAREKLLQLHFQNLKRATAERDLDNLDKAIESAHMSQVAPELRESEELAEAERTRDQLQRLKLYLHKVLSLNKATISEIHSYQRPRPLVHEVMKATFRILGEPNNKLQSWPYVQNSMRQLGPHSMLNRMRKCDVVDLRQKRISDAETYIGETSQRQVRMTSAGAGTFYIWSHNMITEFYDHQESNSSKNSNHSFKNKNQTRPHQSKAVDPYHHKNNSQKVTHSRQEATQRSPSKLG